MDNAKAACGYIAQAAFPTPQITSLLEALDRAAHFASFRVRAAVVSFIQYVAVHLSAVFVSVLVSLMEAPWAVNFSRSIATLLLRPRCPFLYLSSLPVSHTYGGVLSYVSAGSGPSTISSA